MQPKYDILLDFVVHLLLMNNQYLVEHPSTQVYLHIWVMLSARAPPEGGGLLLGVNSAVNEEAVHCAVLLVGHVVISVAHSHHLLIYIRVGQAKSNSLVHQFRCLP